MRRSTTAAAASLAIVAILLVISFAPGSTPGAISRASPAAAVGASALASPSSGRVASGPSPIAPCLSIPRSAPCGPGPDRAVVDLLSNASDSGARLRVGVMLPSGGTNPAAVLSSFWVGLWVTGAPCSIDGASYLSVTLYPPFSPAVTPASPDWVAQVPVVDLAPSGSCDPLCQNTSAQSTVDGVPTCEDNIVVGGGWPASATVGRFAPGDQLSISLWGGVGDPSPLNIWANDTTTPTESAHWQYGSSSTTTGVGVGPRFAVSNTSDGGWATPFDAAFGMTACPEVTGPASCNTYDGPVQNLTALPVVTSASYWNSTSSAIESYPWIATASSSGGCQGAPPLSTCPDASGFGGTGTYPTLAIVRYGAMGSAWRIGGLTGSLANYGGSAREFAPNGSALLTEPASLTINATNGSAGMATVNVTVADPRGAAEVRIGTFWCSGSGTAFTQLQAATPGTRAEVSFVLNLSATNGTLPFWVSEHSAGSVWSPAIGGNLTMTGGTSSCTLPSPAAPWFGPSNATAVAGGYQLHWHENTSLVRGFVVVAHDVRTGANQTFHVGNVSSARILGLASTDIYSLNLTAIGYAGTASRPTGSLAALPLVPLVVVAVAPSLILWHGSPPTTVNVSIRGGAAPYQLLVRLANGSSSNVTSPTNSTTVSLPLGSSVGFDDFRLSVQDANGVPASAPPVVVDVWAGPLAPIPTITAGNDFLGLSWPPSTSPSTPVLRYAVYLSSDAGTARTGYLADLANSTLPGSQGGVEVWNTTNTSTTPAWPNNVTAFALVVPYDAFGPGFTSATPVNATPAPLNAGPIVGGPGGPAPYTATFTCLARTGTNDPITEAVYSFPGFAFVAANVTRTDPGTVYINATAPIKTVGLVLVLLHVGDAFGGTAIVTSEVWVSNGAPPVVFAQANPSPAYVGVSVNFTASATGTGPFEYQWSFGDSANGSGRTAVHTYATSGRFTASVLVTDNGTGSAATANVVEVVYAPPSVAIVTSAGPNGSGSYAFHATLIGGSGNGTFAWAFGDGFVARGENVTHDFHSAGVFTVNLTATDASLRTTSASETLDVVLTSGTTGGGSGLGAFTPLALGLLAAAVLGWVLAVVALLRLRVATEASEKDEEPPTNWD
ncbi:MAG: PKD domain-containing protein [Thermoplasmata archaeon]|nr:PKD domain-containing protein [Thermoplasmata archaeon]